MKSYIIFVEIYIFYKRKIIFYFYEIFKFDNVPSKIAIDFFTFEELFNITIDLFTFEELYNP